MSPHEVHYWWPACLAAISGLTARRQEEAHVIAVEAAAIADAALAELKERTGGFLPNPEDEDEED